jgi:hypothetical protein
MFTAEQRVLELAQSDPRVTAGALTGSLALGGGDRWSDIDVAFGIAAGSTPEAVLEDWTAVLAREWGVLHHFDLPFGSSVYRVFLLPSGLEVDVAATPAEDFGARPQLPYPLRSHPAGTGHATAERFLPHRDQLALRPACTREHRAPQALASRILDRWDSRAHARPGVPAPGRERPRTARRRSPPQRGDRSARRDPGALPRRAGAVSGSRSGDQWSAW